MEGKQNLVYQASPQQVVLLEMQNVSTLRDCRAYDVLIPPLAREKAEEGGEYRQSPLLLPPVLSPSWSCGQPASWCRPRCRACAIDVLCPGHPPLPTEKEFAQRRL